MIFFLFYLLFLYLVCAVIKNLPSPTTYYRYLCCTPICTYYSEIKHYSRVLNRFLHTYHMKTLLGCGSGLCSSSPNLTKYSFVQEMTQFQGTTQSYFVQPLQRKALYNVIYQKIYLAISCVYREYSMIYSLHVTRYRVMCSCQRSTGYTALSTRCTLCMVLLTKIRVP